MRANNTTHFKLSAIAVLWIAVTLGCSMPAGDIHVKADTSGLDIVVHHGESIQAAIDRAKPGDRILLDPGVNYSGFALRKKNGTTAYIIIETDPGKLTLPPEGTRIDDSYRDRLASIYCSEDGSAITADPGASYYKIRAVTFHPPHHAYNLINLGSNSGELAHHLIFEQIYAYGSPIVGSPTTVAEVRRGIAANCGEFSLKDSVLKAFREKHTDTQAIAAWDGEGPFYIINNFLSAAGEVVMFGGNDPGVRGRIPGMATGPDGHGITVRLNTITRPIDWKDLPDFVIKNLLELKNAMNAWIDGNSFSNNWGAQQDGIPIAFTTRNQDGACDWCTLKKVTFSNNVLRNTGGGVRFLASDDTPGHASVEAEGISVLNNLFADPTSDQNPFAQLYGGRNVVFKNNTFFNSYMVTKSYGPPTNNFTFDCNLGPHGSYGAFVDGLGGYCQPCRSSRYGCNDPFAPSDGNGFSSNSSCAVAAYNYRFEKQHPLYNFGKNVFLDVPHDPPTIPSKQLNFFTTHDQVGFADYAGGDYRLASNSLFHGKCDGKDPGVDFDQLQAALSGGDPLSGPTVSITSPVANSTVSGTTIGLAVSVTGGTVNSIQYRLGDTVIATSSSSPFNATWNSTTVANGSYRLTADGYDANANKVAQSTSVSIAVNNGGTVSVAITSPVGGSTVNGTVTVVATATGDGISAVKFYVDNAVLGTGASVNSTYTIAWNTTNVSAGTHTLVARAVRGGAEVASSSPVAVTVNNGPPGSPWPQIWIVYPGDATIVSGSAVAAYFNSAAPSSQPITSTELYVGGTLVASSAGFAFWLTFDSTKFPDGTYRITAHAHDTQGNVGVSPAISLRFNNGIGGPP